MRIAIWTERFYPDIGGLEKSMLKLALELSKENYTVEVITSQSEPKVFDEFSIINFDNTDFISKSVQYLKKESFDILYISRIFQNKEDEHIKNLEDLSFIQYKILRIPTTYNIALIKEHDNYGIIEKNIDFIVCQNIISHNQAKLIYPNNFHLLSKNSIEYPKKIEMSFSGNFVFAGRIAKSKNLLNLLKGWQLLRKENNIDNKKLFVYGIPYDLDYFDRCMRIIDKDNSIEFKGEYKSGDLTAINKAFFVIIPSFREGHSNLALESLSFGTPIIASKIPGLEEDMIGLEKFLINNPNDVTEIKEKINDSLKLNLSEYNKIVFDIRERIKEISKKKSIQLQLIKSIKNCQLNDFSFLFIKPESVHWLTKIKSFLKVNEFNILSETKRSDWFDFVNEFYLDILGDTRTKFFEYYKNLENNNQYIILTVQHSYGESIQKLTKLKGEYDSNLSTKKLDNLRFIFGTNASSNIKIGNKTICFNGFHCPRNNTELIKTCVFLNLD